MNTQKALKGVGVTVSILAGMTPFAIAKIRPAGHYSASSNKVNVTKDIRAEANFTVQQNIKLSGDMKAFQFQNGKISEDIAFYKSPRCYLHFKNTAQASDELPAGKKLKVSKIDNTYNRGSVHVVFWFDSDQSISDMTCITNYNHTLTVNELKETLGTSFQINLPKEVAADALANTAPRKNAPVLSEDASNFSARSTRVILKDS